MSVLLFKLYNVPEDEAADVRRLLEEHGFETYETHSGFFGLGVAAIWLVDKAQLSAARRIIDEYEEKRCLRQREIYADQKASGNVPTLQQKLAADPFGFLVTVGVIVLVLLVSIVPIWSLMTG